MWIVIEGRKLHVSIRAVLPPECLVRRRVWYIVTLVNMVVLCELGVKGSSCVCLAEPPLRGFTTNSVDLVESVDFARRYLNIISSYSHHHATDFAHSMCFLTF